MKTIEIDWVKYTLTLLEEKQEEINTVEPVDKYEKIRKVVKRFDSRLIINWENKELCSYKNSDLLFNKKYNNPLSDELHFQETTLDKLEVNDVFVLEEDLEDFKYGDVKIVVKIDNYIRTNYLSADIINSWAYSKNKDKVIKILRDILILRTLKH